MKSLLWGGDSLLPHPQHFWCLRGVQTPGIWIALSENCLTTQTPPESPPSTSSALVVHWSQYPKRSRISHEIAVNQPISQGNHLRPRDFRVSLTDILRYKASRFSNHPILLRGTQRVHRRKTPAEKTGNLSKVFQPSSIAPPPPVQTYRLPSFGHFAK